MRPVLFQWTDNGTMVPEPRFIPLCDKQFVVGEIYPLQVVEPRNMKSHSHYFASLHEIWNNLPEAEAKRFPTAEYLRHWALVEGGFTVEKNFVCDTPRHAKNLAVFIRSVDTYGVIVISKNVVKVFDAKSQSVAAMGAEEFAASKKAVLDIASALIPGLDRKELAKVATKRAPPEKKAKAAPTEAPLVRPLAPEGPLVAPNPNNRTSEPLKADHLDHPKTAPEYFAYARGWIMAAKSIEGAWERWHREREMRDDFRVPLADRNTLTELVELRIVELKETTA
jgi:hypothetical protein